MFSFSNSFQIDCERWCVVRKSLLAVAMVAMIGGVAEADTTTGLIAYYNFESIDPATSTNSNPGDPGARGDTDLSQPHIKDQSLQGRDMIIFNSSDVARPYVEVAGGAEDVNPNTGAPFGQVFSGTSNGGAGGALYCNGCLEGLQPGRVGGSDGGTPDSFSSSIWFKSRVQPLVDDAEDNSGRPFGLFNTQNENFASTVLQPDTFDGPTDGSPFDPNASTAAQSYVFDHIGNTWNPKSTQDTGPYAAKADETWHHYATTFDGDSREFNTFVDGELTSSIIHPNASFEFQSDQTDYEFGGYTGAENRFISGYLDEARLYDRALTQGDVLELFGVPEPTSIAIAAIGLVSFAGLRRRKHS